MARMITMNLLYFVVLILLSANFHICWSFKFLQTKEIFSTVQPKHVVSDFITNVEQVAQAKLLSTVVTEDYGLENVAAKQAMPLDCSQREKINNQPKLKEDSRIKKCCPIGESLSLFGENQTEGLCDSTNLSFNPTIISAVLYDNCIEDMENSVDLSLEIGNPCNASIVYSSAEEQFYVLQDGSLLIMNEYANESYVVQQNYCMDVDNISGLTFAIVCISSVEEHLKRSQIMTVAILTLLSIPCLLCVCFLHLALKELRTLHGLSLSLMSLCLALGHFLHSLVHIFNVSFLTNGYAVQYFILSYFFWFLCLCTNVCTNIWYIIPNKKTATRTFVYSNFALFALFSFSGPLILVMMTAHKGLPGMPSYFIQGFTESIRESQRYFIPPISTLLLFSFIIMMTSFFGFQKMKTTIQTIRDSNERDCTTYISTGYDEEKLSEIKKDAKCISLLGFILITTWLFEIVTFYSPGPENYLLLMEMINGIQGVFILLIFLVVRRRRTIILRWWFDRGSHYLDSTELSLIKK